MIPNLTWESLGSTVWDTLASDPDAQWDLATLSVGDISRVAVSETSSLIQSFSTRTDSLSVSVAEVKTLLSLSTASDLLRVAVAEAAGIVGAVVASDTLGVRLTEVKALLVLATGQDILSVALTEDQADLVATMMAQDALIVSTPEGYDVLAQVVTGDPLALALLEAALPAAVYDVSDVLLITFLEDHVTCVEDWPQEAAESGVWQTGLGVTSGWTPEAPAAAPWTEAPTIPVRDEGCGA